MIGSKATDYIRMVWIWIGQLYLYETSSMIKQLSRSMAHHFYHFISSVERLNQAKKIVMSSIGAQYSIGGLH